MSLRPVPHACLGCQASRVHDDHDWAGVGLTLEAGGVATVWARAGAVVWAGPGRGLGVGGARSWCGRGQDHTSSAPASLPRAMGTVMVPSLSSGVGGQVGVAMTRPPSPRSDGDSEAWSKCRTDLRPHEDGAGVMVSLSPPWVSLVTGSLMGTPSPSSPCSPESSPQMSLQHVTERILSCPAPPAPASSCSTSTSART